MLGGRESEFRERERERYWLELQIFEMKIERDTERERDGIRCMHAQGGETAWQSAIGCQRVSSEATGELTSAISSTDKLLVEYEIQIEPTSG